MPEWTMELRRRLRGSGLRGATESEVIEELSQHLEDRYQELVSRHIGPTEARRIVLEELDAEESLGRAVRSAVRQRPEPVAPGARSGVRVLGGFGGDMRYAVRALRRTPGFTAIAAVVIALGIGANTAIFSVVNAVLLRPLPGVRAPSELASVYTSDYSGPRYGASSYPDYEAIEASGAFAAMMSYTPRPLSITVGEQAVHVLGEGVSPNYFGMLGVVPARGRFFLSGAGAVEDEASVVIGHELWQRRFNGAADIVGRVVRVNGQTLTVVGVAPASFRGMMRGVRTDVWVPLTGRVPLAGGDMTHRGNRGLFLVGRLRAGTTIAGVQAHLDGVASQLHAAYPEQWTDVNDRSRVLTVLPEPESRVPRQVRGPVLGMFAALTTVVVIVLLIACSNVANLMLTRASVRTSEMGIRLALGATRGRIVRQLLTESVLLAGVGGVLGVLLAFWATRAVNTIRLPIPVPFALDVSLDVRVLLFAALITVVTGVVFGVLPALQASRSPAPMMQGARSGVRRRTRLRNGLVVVQVAASLVLLTGGGLFLRSLTAAARIDTGMDTANMLLVHFDLETEGVERAAAEQFYAQLEDGVRALPGVAAVTLAQQVPLGMGWSRRGIRVAEYQPQPGEDMEVPYNAVGPGYFETLGIALVRGRGFTPADRAGAPRVVVVNEAFARRFWPGRDALGMRVGLDGADMPFAEVIGVVPDAKYRSLTEEPTPYFYYPYLQQPGRWMTLHVRTAIDPAAVVPGIRGVVRALAPAIAQPQINTLTSHVSLATLPQRIAGTVLGVLGGLALLIAGIGLYGVVSYAVAQRMREFGIRTALGAPARDVQRLVIRDGLRLTLIGVAIGLVLAFGLASLARSLLLVSPFDPVAAASVVVLLTAVATLASYVPARRATRVDPLAVLRAE